MKCKANLNMFIYFNNVAFLKVYQEYSSKIYTIKETDQHDHPVIKNFSTYLDIKKKKQCWIILTVSQFFITPNSLFLVFTPRATLKAHSFHWQWTVHCTAQLCAYCIFFKIIEYYVLCRDPRRIIWGLHQSKMLIQYFIHNPNVPNKGCWNKAIVKTLCSLV